ncbi:MAG: helix-turn-helix transcriptional regulator [Firmicutes bacterium]|nr:helix-turn-helix transcriptional regulator [Bacillota bacterium]
MNEYLRMQLREGRLNKNLKQSDVTKLTGIKNTTLSNYENGVTEPDIDTFLQLCELYELDYAEILADAYGLSVQNDDFEIKNSELELIKKYRALDAHGKEMLDIVLEKEYERVKGFVYEIRDIHPLMVAEQTFEYGMSAAHERTDINVTDAMRKHDDNIMDSEDF